MKYMIAVDQSTSGTKVALFNERLEKVRSLQKHHRQFYPQANWAEHDAQEIWCNTVSMLTQIAEGIPKSDIVGIGLTNQRETSVIWERSTGVPLCNAIVWQDTRAKKHCDALAPHSDRIFRLSGLRPSPYYSAGKVSHLLHSNPEYRQRAGNGELCFGTIDSYLLYRLTSGKSFFTDMTNASRTQLMDIERLEWSDELARFFDIPLSMLAQKILPADAVFGVVDAVPALSGVPIVAMLGDSHASFFGQNCLKKGMVKTSFGTGSSIMMNIGEKPVWAEKGLSTSIGIAWGERVYYALEGNVTCSADTLVWIKDYLHLIDDMGQLGEAASVDSSEGVYLVPAFSGLGAPWFQENAKAVLYGMNRGTTRAHVLRAALASIAHQNADVLDAMSESTGIPITCIRADGGGCTNPLLVQMQSDYVPCEVIASTEKDLTLRGIARMAGISAGIFDGNMHAEYDAVHYTPKMNESQRLVERTGWMDAVRRCM